MSWREALFRVAFSATVFGLWWLLAGCAAPSRLGLRSVSVCVEYSNERTAPTGPELTAYRGRRAGASTCAEFSE